MLESLSEPLPRRSSRVHSRAAVLGAAVRHDRGRARAEPSLVQSSLWLGMLGCGERYGCLPVTGSLTVGKLHLAEAPPSAMAGVELTV